MNTESRSPLADCSMPHIELDCGLFSLGAVPAWVASARGASEPDLARPLADGPCIEPAAVMRRTHPALLIGWRDQVVRSGERLYILGLVSRNGFTFRLRGCS